jgi:hypothetical protein
VGSKTLKLWAAIAIASVFEFLGAFFLGGSVTRTIAGNIARTSTFASTPALFMYGMLCAEAGAMVWALFATYMELPISTTHSIGERSSRSPAAGPAVLFGSPPSGCLLAPAGSSPPTPAPAPAASVRSQRRRRLRAGVRRQGRGGGRP